MKRVTTWVVFGVLTAGSIAIAASLDDFKEAVEQKGCASIPYEDIRDSCKSHSENVQVCSGRNHSAFMTTAVTDQFRALMQQLIRRFGLLGADRTPCGKPLASSDAHALMLLLRAGEDGMLPSALAAQLGIDKSTGTRVVARLTDAGHIASAPSTDDARARPIRLTKKGARVAADVEHASRDRFARLLESVPARRREGVVERSRV